SCLMIWSCLPRIIAAPIKVQSTEVTVVRLMSKGGTPVTPCVRTLHFGLRFLSKNFWNFVHTSPPSPARGPRTPVPGTGPPGGRGARGPRARTRAPTCPSARAHARGPERARAYARGPERARTAHRAPRAWGTAQGYTTHEGCAFIYAALRTLLRGTV